MTVSQSKSFAIADAALAELPRGWSASAGLSRSYRPAGLGGRVAVACEASVSGSEIYLNAFVLPSPRARESSKYLQFEARVARKLRRLGFENRRSLVRGGSKWGLHFGKLLSRPAQLAEGCADLDALFSRSPRRKAKS